MALTLGELMLNCSVWSQFVTVCILLPYNAGAVTKLEKQIVFLSFQSAKKPSSILEFFFLSFHLIFP